MSYAEALSMLPRVFHQRMKAWKLVSAPAIIYLLLLAARAYQEWNSPYRRFSALGLLVVLWAAHLLVLAIRWPRSVTVSIDGLAVRYTLWKRLLPYTAIADIELDKKSGPNAHLKDRVRIVLANRRAIVLTDIQEGTRLLYQVLRTAWQHNHSAVDVALYPSEPNRTFPVWLTPAAFVLALFAAFVAPRDMWRELAGAYSAPNTRILATFPKVRTGWARAPVASFSGELRSHRWNIEYTTGTFIHSQTDFYLNDSISINFTRVFLNREINGAFGIGMNAAYDMTLAGDADRFSYVDLVMPDGEQFHFRRVSPGTSWRDSVFRCESRADGSPNNPFWDSSLWWDGVGWRLKLTDRTLIKLPAVIGDFKPGRGSPISIEDSKGNILKIDRDGEGNILSIISPHGAFIHFRHDLYNRITRASDSLGHAIQYSYDDYGRLAVVNDSEQGVTRYFYDSSNNLAKVTMPDGRLWLAVEYDNQSRVTKMTFEDGSSNSYSYVTGAHGAIIAVKVISSNGSSKSVVIENVAS
jgi:YD repeat-containing protein